MTVITNRFSGVSQFPPFACGGGRGALLCAAALEAPELGASTSLVWGRELTTRSVILLCTLPPPICKALGSTACLDTCARRKRKDRHTQIQGPSVAADRGARGCQSSKDFKTLSFRLRRRLRVFVHWKRLSDVCESSLGSSLQSRVVMVSCSRSFYRTRAGSGLRQRGAQVTGLWTGAGALPCCLSVILQVPLQ